VGLSPSNFVAMYAALEKLSLHFQIVIPGTEMKAIPGK
jgi:hypothetical protein